MDFHSKLIIALKLIEDSFQGKIISNSLEQNRPVLKVVFKTGWLLYIRYNVFNDYSYNLIFSREKNDRIRFDNYDEKWKVSSQPHHFHPRYEAIPIESEMNGNPEHDIPIFITLLLNFGL